MVIGDVSAPPEELDAPGVVDPEEVIAPAEEPEQTERAVRTAGPPRPSALVVVLAVILFASIVAAFLGVFAFGLSSVQEHRSQQQLYAQFRQLLPGIPVAPSIGGHIPNGAPIALLNAPAAGIHNVMVIEGTSSGDLLEGPGHLADTPLPGQGGEAVLVGKSTTAGAPFANVARLRKGDVITVRTGQGLFRFSVQGLLPPGTHQPAILATRGRLVLVTSAERSRRGRPRTLSDHRRGGRAPGQGRRRTAARAEDRPAFRGARPDGPGGLALRRAVVGRPRCRLGRCLVALGAPGNPPRLDHRGARAPGPALGSEQRGHAPPPERLLTIPAA